MLDKSLICCGNSYSCEPLGQIVTEQRTIARIQKNLSYKYNLDNSIATMTYPYTYDADGTRVEKSNGSTGTIYLVHDAGHRRRIGPERKLG